MMYSECSEIWHKCIFWQLCAELNDAITTSSCEDSSPVSKATSVQRASESESSQVYQECRNEHRQCWATVAIVLYQLPSAPRHLNKQGEVRIQHETSLYVHHNGKYVSCQVMFIANIFCGNWSNRKTNSPDGKVITKLPWHILIAQLNEVFRFTTYWRAWWMQQLNKGKKF